MGDRPDRCQCGHPRHYHHREGGFYDDRPCLGRCDVVGCTCEKFDPTNREVSRE